MKNNSKYIDYWELSEVMNYLGCRYTCISKLLRQGKLTPKKVLLNGITQYRFSINQVLELKPSSRGLLTSYESKDYWTLKEAMQYLRIKSRTTMYYRFINTGKLIPHKAESEDLGRNIFHAKDVKNLLQPIKTGKCNK